MNSDFVSSFNASFFWKNYAAGIKWQRDFAMGVYGKRNVFNIPKEPPPIFKHNISVKQNAYKKNQELRKKAKCRDDDAGSDDVEISDEMLEFLCKRMEEKAAMNSKGN